ncbi:uncharacterized protein [Procambarus clarkii]|uniref:uncharacterized protein isoform X3 n=1 Tax=Procambarus clarkii TaxID=6728 RepID=UPI0037437846
MSILAKRLSTCVPPEVVTSPRRASFSACEGAASLLQPDTPASPFLKHASFHLLRSPVQLLPGKSTCTSDHRASVGPSDLLLEQPSASYLRRKRTSLDPSWLSSSLNYQDESIRSPVGAAGHHGSPNLECKKPVPLYIPDGDSPSPSQSFIRASEPQNVLPVSPRNQLTPNAYRRNTFHHLLETIPTPPSLRRRTCSTHIISPAADFLGSSLVTESCVRRSPFSTCKHLSPCFELSPPNTHFDFNPCDQEGGKEEDLEDTGNRLLGLRKGRALSVDHGGRRLEVPRIALNSPETSLAVSCKSPALDPTPSSLGLSPKIAALYHLQHHTLATPRPPGVTEGRVGLRAAPRCSLAVEQPTSVGPGLASRRASWHVSDGGHLDPWVKTHLSNLHSTRYSSVIAFLDHRRECQSVDVTPRVGRVMGRGGFGTVKVGCHRGLASCVKVAIKVLRGTRAATSSRREAHALLLTPHAHLASTHALVTPTLTTGEACITWATAYLKDRQEKKQIVPREVAASMFSLGPEDASGCQSVGEEEDECWGRPG